MSNPQFTIEEKISESGSTTVYRAFDLVLHRTVLLKVLHKHLAGDPELRERFTREARACAALRSEHIVQIYDMTDIDGAPAIVMEFVEGKSLKDIISDGTHRSQDFARRVAVHVLRALSLAHARGIIHRDIKPGNILVDDSGTIKVTDFGLAYVAQSPSVTREGTVLGTPAYMSPEQVRGDDLDARTDFFALGATVIEVLTGERVFEGTTYSECLKKVLSFNESDLSRYAPLCSAEFLVFVGTLMKPKKEDRFSSAREALRSIDEKSSSVFIAPISSPESKKKLLFGVAAALILILVFSIVSLMTRNRPDAIPRDSSKVFDSSEPLHEIGRGDDSAIQQRTTDPPVQVLPQKKITDARDQASLNTDSSEVYFTSSPWAKVYLNSTYLGETPMAQPLRLAAGKYTVTFTNPLFDPLIQTVTVDSDRDLKITGNFYDHAGYLKCVVTPWAEIYIDEQYKNTTPLDKPLLISEGPRTIRFKNTGHPDIVKKVTIVAKDTLTLNISFNQ